MSTPKLHHYVPQFHLRRFTDDSGRLWAWDRDDDRVFPTSPGAIAAENHFYRLTHYEALGHDGSVMEKQLSALEAGMAEISDQWLAWVREMASHAEIPIPPTNRDLASKYFALQYLRTKDIRDILGALAGKESEEALSTPDIRILHTELLWNERAVGDLEEQFREAVWIFALNQTAIPFVTSDNPIAFRKADNRRWLRLPSFASGTYAVFPLSPDVVLFCFPRAAPWKGALDEFSNCISPATLNEEMVCSENTGQVFMASRFIISNRSDFDTERKFAATIGTDVWKG